MSDTHTLTDHTGETEDQKKTLRDLITGIGDILQQIERDNDQINRSQARTRGILDELKALGL